MKITYHVACSRDGFIAREDGDVSWLEETHIGPEESGLAEFFADIDGLVMGRKTYDFVFDYGSWPYEDKPTWICTSRPLQPLEGANLIVVDTIDAVVTAASTAGMKHLWLVGGGKLASGFMAKGLITNVCIAELPIDLGSGIPVFSDHVLSDLASFGHDVTSMQHFRKIEFVIQNSAN